MLVQRLQRQPNVTSTLVQCLTERRMDLICRASELGSSMIYVYSIILRLVIYIENFIIFDYLVTGRLLILPPPPQ